MPMWPYKDFEACVLDQKSKWHSDDSADKICWAMKAKIEMWENLSQELSEETNITPQLAKRIIDNLQSRWLDLELFNQTLWEIKCAIKETAIAEKLNKSSDEEIWMAINEVIWEWQEMRMSENIEKLIKKFNIKDWEHFLYFQPQIIFSEWENIEEKEYELITTAKQTDSRYWDFTYSKDDLETMAKNFNENIVWTEIPVDLNHDPEHIAYAWIKPGSMKIKESSKLDGQYSLYAQLYKFTPEGKDIITTWKIRYFSLQIQNSFTKFVDKSKKIYNLVIRALAFTNMPVIKDMAPTFNESNILFANHTKDMELKELESAVAQKDIELSEKDKALSEETAKNKTLSEELAKVNEEKREKVLSEWVEKLCLSENKNIAFKWWEKEKILAFVKTLSENQAKEYFELHEDIITWADMWEHWEAWSDDWADANEIVEAKAVALSQEKWISLTKAYEQVLSENPELAKQTY